MTSRRARPSLPRAGRVAMIVVVLLAALGLSGTGAVAATTPAGKGWVRAAHLVPGAGPVRIDLAKEGGGPASPVQMSPDADYGDVTDYQQLAPGTYTVTVRRPQAPAGSDPMLSRSFVVKADQAYTLAALGTEDAPRLVALSDDLTPPAAGAARVRLLPAAGTVPQVTVRAEGGPTIATDAVLGQVTAYAAVPAGTWTLDASAGDRTASQSIDVAAGSVYTVLVLDGAGGDPRLTLVTDSAGAVMAPAGGVATGAGGTAVQPGSGPWAAGGIGIGMIAAAVLLLAARRRPLAGRPATARHVSGR